FENGSLSGTVSFTVPATTFDGEPATGNVTYTIKANGETLATGTAACGEAVSVPVTLPAAGSYSIVVTLTNATGDSPAASVATYAGKDTPEAPEVTVTYDSAAATATISWTAVTGTVNGGYMDATAVTYTVTRYPGATVVAENITATTATDDLTGVNGKIYYTVEASADGLTSQAGQSNSILLMAALVPPFLETFDNAEALEPFTIINANGDTNYSGEPNTWHFYDNHARVSYNSTMAMDDWLISPAIKLEAGKAYDVVADLWANGMTFPERVEVKMGKAATIEGLTTVLLEPTLIGTTYTEPYKLSVSVTVDADGEYYIGFHGMSDADMYALHLDNFGVTAPLAESAPAAVDDFSVTADPAGALSVNITFTAPAKAIDGSALTSLDKIVLKRGEDEVKTWDNPAPGAALAHTDAVEEGGDYTYSVQAFNADGAGLVKEASAFVGFTRPEAPTGVKLQETANPGEVTLTWNAVTADLNGVALPASEVTYQVFKMASYSRTPVSEKISGTSFTFQAVEAGTQDFVQFMICAYDYAGESAVAYSPFKPVGTPYTSFDIYSEEDFGKYVFGLDETGGGEWYAGGYKAVPGIKSDADGSGLMLYMVAYSIDDAASISTGKIDLSATEKPGMVFYTYPFGEDDTNVITVTVTDVATGETSQVYTSTVAETGEILSWNRVNVDLAAYASKTVQLTIEACTKSYGYVLVDGWKVDTMRDYDLAATGITAPATVAAGADFDVAVTVANNGTKDASDFTVALFADGEKLAEKTVESLASCKNTVLTFATAMDALASEPVEFYANVTYTADENSANNTSETIEVAPKISKLPRVTDLAAEAAADGVALSWSEPDIENIQPEPVLESFEDAEYGAQEYEGWTFVDVDQSPVGTLFYNYEIPGITWRVTPLAYVLLDSDEITLDAYQPHSGKHCFASIFNANYSAVDDWAISPTLTGDAQTITFWAKSVSGTYMDDIEMYYSTGSLDPKDFEKVGETVKYVPAEWTQYSFEVPAGAKHFAVRSCSGDGDALLLDDFSFVPAGATADLSIKGYDVYRDGEKITDEPVEECEYTDTEATDGEHTYVVITVYTTGISAPSNSVTLIYDGIADATAAGIAITAGKGSITVTGAEGKLLTVAAADGKLYFNGAAAARQTIAAPAGIYVVKAGTKTAKVAVK
ncbi:MAG: choice-of-anchor J domain-containing protein, partial [Muribaculaceae bacterium]|nr:choice-of-anchor J domain-containing protein [Muribaculaceae bacterium]